MTDSPSQPDSSRRTRTVFVDWQQLEDRLSSRDAQRTAGADSQRATSEGRATSGGRILTTVDDQADDVRANVQDSARAVLAWVASVTRPGARPQLNDILDRCLKPGPDTQRVNYTALAEEISRTMGVQITPKRVRTAVAHIRRGRAQQVADMNQPTVKHRLDALHTRLEASFAALTGAPGAADDDASLRREVAVEVLGAVRRAASRVIENDFGEGIPRSVDIDQLEGRFLDFVRDLVRRRRQLQKPVTDSDSADNAADPSGGLADDLNRLLVTLGDYDGLAEDDMRLVVDGARVVAALLSPNSLPGVIAQLNVLVSGRYLLESDQYVAELISLADAAAALRDDPATATLMNWVRRQPEEQRLPGPGRVASYCLNNAATHLFERVYCDQLPTQPHLDTARQCLERMRHADGGFALVRTTTLIDLLVEAKRTGDATPVENHFRSLGAARSLELLRDLAKYDNCPPIHEAAQHHAAKAIPALAQQLIDLR